MPPPQDRQSLDLVRLTAKEAFYKLPKYLRWDPHDDDSLPVWEKFFVVSLKPEDATRSSIREHESVRSVRR